jgi:molecular chaperone DnaJ
MAKDYYKILGVSQGASLDEIKQAYRKLAKQHHPDLHQGDKHKEEAFKEINEAYKVLSDPKARANYDRFGASGGDFSSGFTDHQGFDFDFDDLFSSFFGGRPRRGYQSRPRRGRDINIEIELTLEEVAQGDEKVVTLKKDVLCPHCDGTGGEPPSGVETCSLCNGSGVVQTTRGLGFGIFSTTAPCRRCNGTGKVVTKPCKECRGQGTVRVTEEIVLNIPPGVDTGDMLRMPGKGEIGAKGGPPGDLIAHIKVANHPVFQRDGADLVYELPIDFATAALGGSVDVPTISGDDLTLKIPPHSEGGTVFRIGGQGLERMRQHGRGNLLVKVSIDVPKRLSGKAKRLLEELKSEL